MNELHVNWQEMKAAHRLRLRPMAAGTMDHMRGLNGNERQSRRPCSCYSFGKISYSKKQKMHTAGGKKSENYFCIWA